MKRPLQIILIPILFCAIQAHIANAQPEEFSSPMDRIFFGGNFGLQIGTITNIEVSPLAGYYITPRLAGGIGLRYEFYKDSRDYFGYQPFKTNIYGGSVFGRYLLIRNLGELFGLGLNLGIIAHTEYEILSLEKKYFEVPVSSEEGRFELHSVLAGGGLYQSIGKRSGITMLVLWNLNQTASSIYSNPVIRIGFNF